MNALKDKRKKDCMNNMLVFSNFGSLIEKPRLGPLHHHINFSPDLWRPKLGLSKGLRPPT